MGQRFAHFIATALISVSTCAAACGDYVPTRGGQMNDDGGETAMELVQQDKEVLIYLEDHGLEISTKGVYGTLRYTRNGRSMAATLSPAGGNLLKARLSQPLRTGDKVVAEVNLVGGGTATGTFQYGLTGEMRRLPNFAGVGAQKR